MLFSEPKIPQGAAVASVLARSVVFQCSSASRKFLKFSQSYVQASKTSGFSALQRAENSSRTAVLLTARIEQRVSVLFSEPKIPQDIGNDCYADGPWSFSALQRAENSSSHGAARRRSGFWQFQCSSASRKFLKCGGPPPPSRRMAFQCSSASRKFLKTMKTPERRRMTASFSALQRAENSSSIDRRAAPRIRRLFQCSSASRKFLKRGRARPAMHPHRVSVLFSEPKIPQADSDGGHGEAATSFSALQRAENSSRMHLDDLTRLACATFQCSSASRKFLKQRGLRHDAHGTNLVSVLFSEPKIPQAATIASLSFSSSGFSALQRAENSSSLMPARRARCTVYRFSALQRAENSSRLRTLSRSRLCRRTLFQCSSASRKFLKSVVLYCCQNEIIVSVLFSEPKIPQGYWALAGVWTFEVSVLFSEPKIPQASFAPAPFLARDGVSVLFSEPKIPQAIAGMRAANRGRVFQCSSASRKFLKQGCGML